VLWANAAFTGLENFFDKQPLFQFTRLGICCIFLQLPASFGFLKLLQKCVAPLCIALHCIAVFKFSLIAAESMESAGLVQTPNQQLIWSDTVRQQVLGSAFLVLTG
jgi:hypothetical protein